MTSAPDSVDSSTGPDPDVGVWAVAALRRLVEQLEDLQVANARSAGWSWAEIAAALGVSTQAVQRSVPVTPEPERTDMFERFASAARSSVIGAAAPSTSGDGSGPDCSAAAEAPATCPSAPRRRHFWSWRCARPSPKAQVSRHRAPVLGLLATEQGGALRALRRLGVTEDRAGLKRRVLAELAKAA